MSRRSAFHRDQVQGRQYPAGPMQGGLTSRLSRIRHQRFMGALAHHRNRPDALEIAHRLADQAVEHEIAAAYGAGLVDRVATIEGTIAAVTLGQAVSYVYGRPLKRAARPDEAQQAFRDHVSNLLEQVRQTAARRRNAG